MGGGAAVLPAGPADAHHPPQARTTPAVRAEIAHSTKSSGVLAKRYGVSTETFRKWRKRGPDDEIGERLEWDRPIVGVQRVFVQDPEMPRPRVAWCSHYAHRSYAHEHHGDLHLYGRSHGRLPGTRTRTRTSTSLDVGVDCWDWTPVRLEAILKRIAETPETDPVA
ncbi:protein of unknown function [Methylorubrum extorquens DM4]|uniref:Transposase n=1 Tax=Methylorubrum extorquens (strain DSM 6343 / CIP 106787 / DM4) TaxID=661410 RepID=C7CEU9_METED|nr:protein of unknown function [Methylorubrum extorquens DM4]